MAEEYSLPITLVILVFVFGGLAAAGLPVLAAVVSGASVMTVLLGFATLTDLDSNAVTVVTLLALGLSIDYGLLLVGRYREELGRGYEPDVAIARAWATAGRTILFSALTVAAAMIGLARRRIRPSKRAARRVARYGDAAESASSRGSPGSCSAARSSHSSSPVRRCSQPEHP